MDLRNSLFSSKGNSAQRGPGLPPRQTPRGPGGPQPDGGYGSPRQQPSPGMPPSGYDSPRGGYGAPPQQQRTPSGYSEKPRSRPVRLRVQKIVDKNLADQYIYGNL